MHASFLSAAQCETIHLTWSRGAGTGPNPVAPYFLQIYTSAFVFPFIVSAGSGLSFDWQVPFHPGTLYQICMFDANGASGGCQSMYTMIANATTAAPSCNNVTFPLGPLDVAATVNTGPLSQYGWIDECSDIQVTPKNGTPPYIFTVAPTLHPPHNMTGTDHSPMNWTVSLSWGLSFFISVVDSDMNFWAYGPLHSGQGTSTGCLAGTRSKAGTASPVTAVASGIGGLFLGLAAGLISAVVYFRQRQKRGRGHPTLFDSSGDNGASPYLYSTATTASLGQYKALPSGHNFQDPSGTSQSPSANDFAMQRMQRESTQYQIEPFTPPAERGMRHSSYTSEYGAQMHSGSPSATGGGNIYVVHHDAGHAPVTVYHQEGTEVVELPPRYADGQRVGERDDPSDRQSVSGIISEPRSSSYTAQEIVSPLRRPNRPSKPRQ
ncbi:hypothetical protein B0H15DRAFT_768478 [Mycena belliarum]|uniref:Uncharacterized protein n=1 Tax=Mycena belliarum TaxID=1033014 RepID=A0AAD6XYS2_9AGAR|nr:hypothetical protein B0H15DRAFT_768478 [Mycena belliae]